MSCGCICICGRVFAVISLSSFCVGVEGIGRGDIRGGVGGMVRHFVEFASFSGGDFLSVCRFESC